MKLPAEQLLSEEPVLVIRFSSLGDILLTAPALRALRRRFPASHIDLLVAREYEAAARLIPGPSRVLTFDRRSGLAGLLRLRGELSRRYAVLVDLQNSVRSTFLRATTFPTLWTKAKRFRFRRWVLIRFKKNLYRGELPVPERYLAALEPLGAPDDGGGLELDVPPELSSWAAEYLGALQLDIQPVVALCPGARHNTKRWPAERWIELGLLLRQSGYGIMVVGAPAEAALVNEVSAAVDSAAAIIDRSIAEVAALFTRTAAVVSNDSGLMHLAAGVGAPVVAIFGPTVAEFGFYPWRARAQVFAHELYCRPCTAIGGPRCPEGHFRCMLQTMPTDVHAAVLRLLTPPGNPAA